MKRDVFFSTPLLLIFLVTGYSCCKKSSPLSVQESKPSEKSWLWKIIDYQNIKVSGKQIPFPVQFITVELNTKIMREYLATVNHKEGETALKSEDIPLPFPDGKFYLFRIKESSAVDATLLQKYPHLRTYGGQGIDDPAATAKIDFMPSGFHAYVITPQGSVILEPYSEGDTLHYFCYYKHHSGEIKQPFEIQSDSINK